MPLHVPKTHFVKHRPYRLNVCVDSQDKLVVFSSLKDGVNQAVELTFELISNSHGIFGIFC